MAITNKVASEKERLNTLKGSFIFKNPQMLFVDKAYNYNDLVKRLNISMQKVVDDAKNNYVQLLSKLEILNPITTLKRGYSVTLKDDKIIKSIKNLSKGDEIKTSLSDGKIVSIVEEIYEED